MPKDLSELFLCSWGDIQLFVEEIEWDAGQTQVIHELAVGDVHPVQPRGAHLRTATLKLLFDDFDGARETGYQAFRRFERSVQERRIFTHPMDGSYFARIGDFKPTIDKNSVVNATCEIIPDGDVVPVSPAGAGTSGISGESSVAAAGDAMNQTFHDSGIGFSPDALKKFDFSKPIDLNISASFSVDASASFSANLSASASATASASASAQASATAQAQAGASALAFASVFASATAMARVTAVAEISGMASADAFAFAYACAALDADARASVASWSDEDVSTRKIMIDCARLSDSISTMIDQGGFTTDLNLWEAYMAAIMLGDSIRSAAIAATSETSSVFVMRVQKRTALLPLCARVYGGAEAQGRERQIMTLNDISTPGWLDPGDYLMPARPSSTAPQLGLT